MASGPITSWEIDGETVETVADFIFLGSKITADCDCSPMNSQVSSPIPQFKSINYSVLKAFFTYSVTLTSIHDHWKNHSLDYVGKVMSLLFNMLSRLVIAFLPRSKQLLISWLQSSSAVILTSKKIKSVTGQRMSGIKA